MNVDKNLNYIVLESVTTLGDNLAQSITTEICRENNKNIIISCVYPGHQGLVLNLSGTGWRECFQK